MGFHLPQVEFELDIKFETHFRLNKRNVKIYLLFHNILFANFTVQQNNI